MKIHEALRMGKVAVGILAPLALGPVATSAQQIAIDDNDIAGVVTGSNGPEAGVWVIAENSRSANEVHQDRGDGRSGSLRRARPSPGNP